MPQVDGVDRSGFPEVDLHPLGALAELHEAAFRSILVTVGDHLQFAQKGGGVAAGDRLVQRDVFGGGRHHEGGRLATARGFEVVDFDGHRSADNHGAGQ